MAKILTILCINMNFFSHLRLNKCLKLTQVKYCNIKVGFWLEKIPISVKNLGFSICVTWFYILGKFDCFKVRDSKFSTSFECTIISIASILSNLWPYYCSIFHVLGALADILAILATIFSILKTFRISSSNNKCINAFHILIQAHYTKNFTICSLNRSTPKLWSDQYFPKNFGRSSLVPSQIFARGAARKDSLPRGLP